VTLSSAADPGDEMFLVASTATEHRWHRLWRSPLLVGAPFDLDRLYLGTADQFGILQVTFDVPEVPAGTTLTWHLQTVSLTAGSEVHLGVTRAMTILDSSF